MRRTPMLLAVTLALCAPPGTGCRYARDRVVDFGQSFHVSVSGSLLPGLYVYGQAPLFATSIGYVPEAVALGSDYGYEWIWHQGAFGAILGGQNVRSELGHPVTDFLDGRIDSPYLDQSHFIVLNMVATDRRTQSAKSTVGLTKVEVGAHALFVGAAVGVDLAELLDFLAGILGWDMLSDDDFVPVYYSQVREAEQELIDAAEEVDVDPGQPP